MLYNKISDSSTSARCNNGLFHFPSELLENYKKKYDSKDRAMAHGIADTFKSVAGSSVTTIAGFLALCVMTFALGRDMGIVMAKGVVIGVICCITTLGPMILYLTE